MATLTFPISRIEGHAQVVIEVEQGKVLEARFQAIEFRGFSYLVQGAPAEQMPVIAPRICGICSTAHHMASVKALEDVYGVTPPPTAQRIRELLMLGQIIQNQATSMFIFTFPDRLGLSSIFEEGERKLQQSSEIATRALRVRQAGTDLITLAGGQFIHPVKAVVGGVISGIPSTAADEMRMQIGDVLPVACDLFDYYWSASLAMGDQLGTWGDDAPACYLSAVEDVRPNYVGSTLHTMCPDGTIGDVFAPAAFREYLSMEETEYSFAGRSRYRHGVVRANSLARINMARRMGTPCADAYLERFKRAFGQPAHAIMLFELARGIELVYALERAVEILSEPLDGGDTALPYTPRDGDGYGLVEAPRGPLIHHYRVVDGLIAQAEFIIPTVHNMLAIERALRVAAERYVAPDRIDMELEHAVGRVVRAFDPCIACATH